MTSEMRYPAKFMKAAEGDWVVSFPGLDGAITGAATIEDAEIEAADCLGSWLARALSERGDVPAPGTLGRGHRFVSVPLWIAPKVALYQTMQARGINKSELARRLGVRETVVRRMLDPDHATKLASIERALSMAGTPVYLVTRGLNDLRKPSALTAVQLSRVKAGEHRPSSDPV
jgi:antitoxin HicB